MNRSCFLVFAISILMLNGYQTGLAQFPKIKIPKITESKPQPTTTDTSQSAPSSSSQPAKSAATSPAATEASINKSSVQFFLQVHKGFKGDPETWSWTPMINFRVNGPFKAGDQLSVEYSLPGKTWKYDCNPQDAGPSGAWVGIRDCGQNPPESEAVTYTGPVDFKINLKNELEGKSAALFSGKFKVEKFHEGVVDLPKFKNNNVYYISYDWTLPLAYIFDEWVYNWEYAKPVGNTFEPPNLTDSLLRASFWFKGMTGGGGVGDVMYGKYEAYLYYKGQMVADAVGEMSGCEVLNRPESNQDSPYGYCLRKFSFQKAMLWDKGQYCAPNCSYFAMWKNPGEYEIKVLRNGKLARTAKFSFGADYKIVDTGIGAQNNMGTLRIIVPAAVLGDTDGTWDKNAWKTDAFYGNPLNGLVMP
jgi:hypothetical protein